MHRGLLIVAAVAALVVVPAAYALLSQHGVKTTGLYEQLPAAATDGTTQYFAWTQNSRSHRNHFDAFLTRTGDPRAKLNAKGEGFIGGIDPPLVAYQQIANGQSNLKLYNADTPDAEQSAGWRQHRRLGVGAQHLRRLAPLRAPDEQHPVRHSPQPDDDEQCILDQGPRFRHAEQVNGDFAAWTRCTKTTCNVVRRQISAVNDTVAPAKAGDEVPVRRCGHLDRDRLRGAKRPKCGADVKVVRYFGAVDPAGGTIVADLGPTGRDFWSAYARENDDGSVDVFYDRYLCSKTSSDIYRIHDPHPGP